VDRSGRTGPAFAGPPAPSRHLLGRYGREAGRMSAASFGSLLRPNRPGSRHGLSLLVGLLLLSSIAGPVGTGLTHARAGPLPSTLPRLAVPGSIHPSIIGPPHPEPTWINVSGSVGAVAPPQGYESSMAFDASPGDNETVLFGGCLVHACPSNQTWVFVNESWHNLTNPSDAPPARYEAAMDYDANMQGVLLFGGEGVSGYLNDTWLFHGGRWTNLNFVGPMAPSPRVGASMAFDPEPEENGSVLFGGCVAVSFEVDCTNDTWVWQGWSGWVLLTPSIAPPAVGYSAMTYDAADQAIVLFGGCSGFLCFGIIGSTWEFYSGQWWAIYPSSGPVNLSSASMVYSPKLGEVLMFGGIDVGLSLVNTTWSYLAGTWTLLAPDLAPSVREEASLALDPSGRTPVLVGGGLSSGSGNDTWVYELALTASLGADSSTAETSQPVGFTISVVGGTGPYSGTVNFGDGTLGLVSGNGSELTTSHIYAHPGNYTATVNLSDDVGVRVVATAAPVDVTSGPLLSLLASSTVTDVGRTVSFIATPEHGVSPYAYTWSFGDGSTGGAGAGALHAYSAPGTYRVTVNLTDSAAGTASASVRLSVNPAPTATLRVNPTTPPAGSLATLLANVTGGTGPYNFSWLFGDGGSSGFATPTHAWASPGAYTVHLWVNDSARSSVLEQMTVEVGPSSPSGGTPSGSSGSSASAPLWFWAGVAVLLAAGVVGAVGLRRRSRSRPPGPPPAAPPGPPPGAST
jgi:PKD repeat protein